MVDSTGQKVFGEGEWLENKHKIKVKRKRWRKLHLGLDLVSGEIVCSDLTTDDVGDPTALSDLLGQIDGPVGKFIADGAYDGAATRDLLTTRLGEIVEVIIPPPKTAVASSQSALNPTVRDRHIADRDQGPDGLAEIHRLQSAQPGRDPNGPMEDGHWAETQSQEPRQSEDRSKNRRPSSQPDD